MDFSLASLCTEKNIPAELYTALVSILPVTELRLAIPVGKCLGLPLLLSFVISVVANIISVAALIYILPTIVKYIGRVHPRLQRWIENILDKTQKRHTEKFQIYGSLLLMLLMSLPLPGVGGYTGVLIGYVFGISKLRTLLMLAIGMTICGILVTLITAGAIKIF